MEIKDLYQVLKPEDIQEKIDLNLKREGITIEKFKSELEVELHTRERKLLELKSTIHPIEIQIQNLKEQIAYISNLKKE